MTPGRVAAEPQTLSPADARAIGAPGRAYRVRVSRRREGSKLVVYRAVPAGSVRAASQGAFLSAVRDSAHLARLRRDGYATVYEVAKHLAWCASWDTMTSRPTWALLAERTGRSRATVHRALVHLQAAGLVGIVATGRSGQYAPAAIDAGAAEAAVYVLCVLSPLAPVDEHETPTGASPGGNLPTHAREPGDCSSEPLRGRPVSSAARPGATVGPDDEPSGRLTAGEARDRRQDERLAPARALRNRLPVLRRISDRHVASLIRSFVLAGWTTSELVHAIDRRPDATPWPHDGANGVGNVGAWLAFRLSAWRDPSGTVQPSPGRRAALERHERLARQRAEREAAAQLVRATPDSPALAQVHALLAARRTSRGAPTNTPR